MYRNTGERSPDSQAALEAKVVRLRAQGLLPRRIAAQLAAEGSSLTIKEVRKILSAQAMTVRATCQALVSNRFLRHDEILTGLIDRVYAELRRDGFDRDKAGALVKLLERQARLLGLDQSSTSTVANDDWLEDKSDAELVELLRTRYNLTVTDDVLRN